MLLLCLTHFHNDFLHCSFPIVLSLYKLLLLNLNFKNDYNFKDKNGQKSGVITQK